jgi:hypothetical protein
LALALQLLLASKELLIMADNKQKLDPPPNPVKDPIATMEGEGGGVVTSPDATPKEEATQHSTSIPNKGELEHRTPTCGGKGG